jgi:Protein of unknown function (DUF1592)/Protein of unknown function (DUF1588)/Protein of unknown function (DUF1587)/Protein of unknown function (DUF1585)/Protein of unknown function (DUF1595)/Ca-dependent carbohydrate-binding module xylan-binding/Planctomycete cytochrome C
MRSVARILFAAATRLALLFVLFVALPQSSRAASKNRSIDFHKQVAPLLDKYCYSCHGNGKHKGDVALDTYKSMGDLVADSAMWAKVLQNLNTHVMPPEKKPQPTLRERELITHWIEAEIFKCDCDKPDPGRVTIRRLNRAEYNNTIRDLVGVKFEAAEDFPADDSGYGFDNIGDVLSVPPVLLEKYLAAAEKIMETAIVTEDPMAARTRRYDAVKLDGSAPGEPTDGGARRLSREGDIFVTHVFKQAGEYALRAHAYGEQAGGEPPKMRFMLGQQELQTFEVLVESGGEKTYEVRLKIPAGTNRFSAAYINNYVNLTDPDRKKRGDRNLVIEWMEIAGPLDVPLPPLPETHGRIFFRGSSPTNRLAYAREIIERFTTRAYRRPVSSDEVSRLLRFTEGAIKRGDSFERGVQLALEAVLISPHFLFRGELQPEPDNPSSVHPINEFALASRLSYFLWSSMPDDELFAQARAGTLRKNLDRQVLRLLKDPKSRALVDNFAGQWLQLRNLRIATPDAKTFPNFDDRLRADMEEETERFFENLIRADRSVLEVLSADYTFINERLARHYGIKGVTGDAFQRVSLKDTGRAGVLTHGSILTLSSNPTRTSPVKRGKYVLENLLGTPPPPAPPDVPELKEEKLAGTLRQRMEAHRENPSCASCHARMDPIGFGLENFDGTGAWRAMDEGSAIDSSGQLVSGESFAGATELASILAKKKREEFVRCLSEKLLTYALGRGMEFYDKCALDEITKGAGKGGHRFSTLVQAIVKSVPFQQRRGETPRQTQASVNP